MTKKKKSSLPCLSLLAFAAFPGRRARCTQLLCTHRFNPNPPSPCWGTRTRGVMQGAARSSLPASSRAQPRVPEQPLGGARHPQLLQDGPAAGDAPGLLPPLHNREGAELGTPSCVSNPPAMYPCVAAGEHRERGTVSSEPRKAALQESPSLPPHGLCGGVSTLPIPPGSIWVAVRDFHRKGSRILSAEVQQHSTLILAASPIHECSQDFFSFR